MPSISARPLYSLEQPFAPIDANRRGMGLLRLASSPSCTGDASDTDSDSSTRTSSPRSCPRSPPLAKVQSPPEEDEDEDEDEDAEEATNPRRSLRYPRDPRLPSQDLLFPRAQDDDAKDDGDSSASSASSSSSSSSSSPSLTAGPLHNEDEHASKDPSSAASASVSEDPTKGEGTSRTECESETEESVSGTGTGNDDADGVESENKLSSKTKKKTKTAKRSLGFKHLSTLYVFEDEHKCNARDTWYSSHDLKAFRADAFLTVNWMVTMDIDADEGDPVPERKQRREDEKLQASCSIGRDIVPSGKSTSCSNDADEDTTYNYCYYSNKYGYNSQEELKRIAERHRRQLLTMGDYEFCPRGIECRTPMGRLVKNKRRMDAMRVVMLYQQMQRQHRRERLRAQRREQQAQHHRRRRWQDDDSGNMKGVLRRPSLPDPEVVRLMEADIDATTLANVYRSYCDESSFDALERGRADASEVGMPDFRCEDDDATCSTTATALTTLARGAGARSPNTGEVLVQCPSLCDEDDEEEEEDFMDNLVSLSLVNREDDDDDDDDDRSNASSSSSRSEISIALADLLISSHDEEGNGRCRIHSGLGEMESSEVEIEFVEDDAERPHRIYCSCDSRINRGNDNNQGNDIVPARGSDDDDRPDEAFRHRALGRPTRSNSWSPASFKGRSSRTATPAAFPRESRSVVRSPPAHSSFSTLELGNLFDWW